LNRPRTRADATWASMARVGISAAGSTLRSITCRTRAQCGIFGHVHDARHAPAHPQQIHHPLTKTQGCAGFFGGVLEPWFEGGATNAPGVAPRGRLRDELGSIERVAKAPHGPRDGAYAVAEAKRIQHLHARGLHQMRGLGHVCAPGRCLQQEDPPARPRQERCYRGALRALAEVANARALETRQDVKGGSALAVAPAA
jgi:hypothetical protein